jgi:hypothetical protein
MSLPNALPRPSLTPEERERLRQFVEAHYDSHGLIVYVESLLAARDRDAERWRGELLPSADVAEGPETFVEVEGHIGPVGAGDRIVYRSGGVFRSAPSGCGCSTWTAGGQTTRDTSQCPVHGAPSGGEAT